MNRLGGSSEERVPVHIVRSEIDGVAFGVEALAVDCIEDIDAPESGEVSLDMDLATLFELHAPSEKSMRRAVVVRTRRELVRLRVGELTRVVSLAPETVHEVPAFLRGIVKTAGICSIFQSGDGLGFLLDVDALGATTAR